MGSATDISNASRECPTCRAVNGPERRFCHSCGAALGCPVCGANNKHGDRYCGGCGSPLTWRGPSAAGTDAGRVLGFPLAELNAEVASERGDVDRQISVEHLGQEQLDDLFEDDA